MKPQSLTHQQNQNDLEKIKSNRSDFQNKDFNNMKSNVTDRISLPRTATANDRK